MFQNTYSIINNLTLEKLFEMQTDQKASRYARKETHILFTIRLNYSESILQGYRKVFLPILRSLHLCFLYD